MSWEPSLVRRDGSALGSADELRTAIDRAFPGTAWDLAPGGEELLKHMQQFGSSISNEWRAMLLQTPPHWHGLYDTEAVTVEVNLGCGEQIRWVNITSHGDHSEARKRLQALADEQGWVIKGDFEE